MIRLGQLVQGSPELRLAGAADIPITGIAYDSRLVEPGYLFVAVRGYTTDGHGFIQDALDRGAVAVALEEGAAARTGDAPVISARDTRRALAQLAARYYGYPSRCLQVAGITGTNGKTTTAYLLEAMLRRAGISTGLLGTVTCRIGDEAMESVRTTPESADLQALYREMCDKRVAAVAMEVSSHALTLHRVDYTTFEVAAFTNLTQDHLDFHKDMDEYRLAKARFFLPLEEDGLGPRHAVLNADDPEGARLAGLCRADVLTYGTGDAGLTGEIESMGISGMELKLCYEGKKLAARTGLTGRFNLHNILCAAGCALALGVELKEAMEAVEAFDGVPGRFQLLEREGIAAVVDYAHTPDSLRQVITAAREVAPGRVIALFGCGGDRDRDKRPQMGRWAGRLADYSFITSDNPRSENPETILDEIEAGIKPEAAGAYSRVADRRQAIYEALFMARPGDLVVVAGKGHERGQIFADRVVPFDDVEVVREMLERIAGERRT
ncbi:MAG: UDP-N-acetylmuramoyl-L-alanyl-D-glutamate--2,6-diaminopimelate ligase [Candidatus Geothermincolia bacterium]